MAHPRKWNEAEDRKRLRRTLKRSQLRRARKEAEEARKEGRRSGGVKRWKYLPLVGAQGAEFMNHRVSAIARLPNSHLMEHGFALSALSVI